MDWVVYDVGYEWKLVYCDIWFDYGGLFYLQRDIYNIEYGMLIKEYMVVVGYDDNF